jgi:transcriptional regulator with XRE-family HTH domain
MKKANKDRFERGGWKIGTASEFLGLTEAEEALIDTKLRLGDAVRALRQRKHLSQAALAKLIGSSQSRVAKLENRDPEVSLDLQMKAIFAANPSARRDFDGLIRKWGGGERSRAARLVAGVRGRRQSTSARGRRPPSRRAKEQDETDRAKVVDELTAEAQRLGLDY